MNATVTVKTTQSHVDRLNNLLAMQGEQPAKTVLCTVFPFLILGITAFVSLITNGWVKLAIKIVVNALNKFQAKLCTPETTTDPINPLEIV